MFWWRVLGLGATLYKIPTFTLIYREHFDSICHSDLFKTYGPDYEWQIDIAEKSLKISKTPTKNSKNETNGKINRNS